MSLAMDQLKQIAIHHAQNLRTRCKFLKLVDHHEVISQNVMFFAVYECKKGYRVKGILLTADGCLVKTYH